MNFEKLRQALIVYNENYICSACADITGRTKQINEASDEELIKIAEKLHFDLSKYKI